MATMRELKGRINSVHSSQKITGAMKMISSARLRKAENKLLQAMPYRRALEDMYAHIQLSGCEYTSPLEEARIPERIAIVVFASDDGLCGAFNINLYKKLLEVIGVYRSKANTGITVYPVGKKILPEVRRIPRIQVGGHPDLFEQKEDVRATTLFADQLMRDFLEQRYDRVEVVYAYYKSMGVQIYRSHQFLPVIVEEIDRAEVLEKKPWYIYEPDCSNILKLLYPLLLHASMYEMYMENRTSEQAARILAMQMANDNAVKLLGNLQLEYNKLRQQGITTELLDIAGGINKD